MEELSQEWTDLVQSYGVAGSQAQEAFEAIVRAYSEAGRYYHTLSHIQQVLATVRELQSLAQNLGAVHWAAWLHDVVYDSRANDNEEKSAEYAARLLQRLGLPPETIMATTHLILCTKTHQADSNDGDAQILLDADLAILGSDPLRYQQYAAAIRQEYGWVAEQDYRVGRSQVLQKFLARNRLYFTTSMFNNAELAARRNVEQELKFLVG
jgi:predicted metal-dependent HD superfamily phosphohydrolase